MRSIGQPQMPAHFEHQNRQRENQPDPEPARHGDQFRVRRVRRQRHAHGFQRHAADRAVARALLDDLRVHRAGVERALRHLGAWPLGREFLGVFFEVLLAFLRIEEEAVAAMLRKVPGVRPLHGAAADDAVLFHIVVGRRAELLLARRAAEEIGPSAMLMDVLGGRRIDRHAADRIACHLLGAAFGFVRFFDVPVHAYNVGYCVLGRKRRIGHSNSGESASFVLVTPGRAVAQSCLPYRHGRRTRSPRRFASTLCAGRRWSRCR